MELEGDLRRFAVNLAQRHELDPQVVLPAIEQEDVGRLAGLLHCQRELVVARLEAVRRALVVESDWGAGCKLLTDDVRREAQDALRELFKAE